VGPGGEEGVAPGRGVVALHLPASLRSWSTPGRALSLLLLGHLPLGPAELMERGRLCERAEACGSSCTLQPRTACAALTAAPDARRPEPVFPAQGPSLHLGLGTQWPQRPFSQHRSGRWMETFQSMQKADTQEGCPPPHPCQPS
jgi:hypothetical protein